MSINVLILTHGKFALGLKDSANMIIGEQENFDFLTFENDMSLDHLYNLAKNKINSFNNENSTILLIDIFGGTPSNVSVMLLGEGLDIYPVSGVNLPMILEILTSRESVNVEELIEIGIEAGINGINDINKEMNKI